MTHKTRYGQYQGDAPLPPHATLAALPGLLILIPAAVGMKGTIFGAIGARLGTANAAGVLEINLEPGGVLRRNVDVAVLTTFSSSLWLALLARFAGALFGQPSISLWDLAVISIVGGAIGSVLVLTITIGLSALSYRLEWDLDSVSTPMVTALGDMTTLPSLFLATFLVRNEAVAIGSPPTELDQPLGSSCRYGPNASDGSSIRGPELPEMALEVTQYKLGKLPNTDKTADVSLSLRDRLADVSSCFKKRA